MISVAEKFSYPPVIDDEPQPVAEAAAEPVVEEAPEITLDNSIDRSIEDQRAEGSKLGVTVADSLLYQCSIARHLEGLRIEWLSHS